MIIELRPNKEALLIRILIRLKIEEEKIPAHSRHGFLPYAQIYKKLCGAFCLKKEELREKLDFWKEIGAIERVGFIGIRLNYKVIEEEIKNG